MMYFFSVKGAPFSQICKITDVVQCVCVVSCCDLYSHLVNSHFVNFTSSIPTLSTSHFVNSHFDNIDQVGIDNVGIYTNTYQN